MSSPGADALPFRRAIVSTPRSYLFVPGNSARKMEKAADSAADAVILDLEDSVAPSQKDNARRMTADFLRQRQAPYAEYWVRLNAVDPHAALAELVALPLTRVHGIVHPKLATHAQLERMSHWLDALETRDAVDPGTIGIIGIITETADSIVGEAAATLARGHPRLRGYSWGTEDLSAVLGRPPLPGTSSANTAITRAVQRHCLFMAAAAGVDAIDGVSADFQDIDALIHECDYARELGYVAKLAIHPSQLAPINAGLAPAAEAIDWARRVHALVHENPETASFQLDGRMVDQPHFNVAARILARAGIDPDSDRP